MLPPLYSCEYCGKEVNPASPDTWKLVTGWIHKNNNTIHYPTAPHGWACNECMFDKKYGIDRNQSQLF